MKYTMLFTKCTQIPYVKYTTYYPNYLSYILNINQSKLYMSYTQDLVDF